MARSGEATPEAASPTPDETQQNPWCLVYDDGAGRDYYFNTETEESRWEVPEGFEGQTIPRFEDLQSSEAPSSEASSEELPPQPSGWHYIDMSGQPQGPFQKEELAQWRAHFPMNTLLWRTEQMNSASEEEKSVKKATYLAEILGDSTLLQRWQATTPGSETRLAPSGTDYQLYLENPVDGTPASEALIDTSVEDAYADAVLAGLPADDETLQLADLAKQSGTSIKEMARVLEAASSDGTTEQWIVKDPRSGKMTAVNMQQSEGQNLYGEFESWIDPSKMAEGLKKSAQYRRKKLPSLWMKQVGYKKRTLPWQDERYDKGED